MKLRTCSELPLPARFTNFTSFKSGLDFSSIGSVCGAMANGSTYDLGAAFARLTCILEDAAELAVEGQSIHTDHNTRLRLVTDLENGINQASLVLKEIKTAMV